MLGGERVREVIYQSNSLPALPAAAGKETFVA